MWERTVALHSLGCKVNAYETSVMEEALKNEGYVIVPFNKKADVYVINTCSVTAISDKKSRQMIRRAKNLNPGAVVVACGCFVQGKEEEVLSLCDIVLGNNKKTGIIEALKAYRGEGIIVGSGDIRKKDTPYEDMNLNYGESKTRAFLKIQDGCDSFCSYCIIPYVRGKSRSRDEKDILEEAVRLADAGHKEIVLCGINLSDYTGRDKGLLDLILKLNEIRGIERIRLGSLEPDIFTKEFTKGLFLAKKVCPHFHLSLQSADSRVLSLMNRRYDENSLFTACKNLREAYENPAICADVIAGFPGESEEDFLHSYENIKKAKLFELHVFPYSERKGTKAAGMEGKLLKSLKEERAKRLTALSEDLTKAYKKSLLGRNLLVLFEETVPGNDRLYTGFCREYVRIYMESDEDLRGQIVSLQPEEKNIEY